MSSTNDFLASAPGSSSDFDTPTFDASALRYRKQFWPRESYGPNFNRGRVAWRFFEFDQHYRIRREIIVYHDGRCESRQPQRQLDCSILMEQFPVDQIDQEFRKSDCDEFEKLFQFVERRWA